MRRQQFLMSGPAIRSGKIKGSANNLVLISQAKGKRNYRIYNASDASLELYDDKKTGNGREKVATCEPSCSVDLEVRAKLKAESTSELDAIFDLVNGVRPIRSGRIRSPKSGSSSNELTLDAGQNNDSILRILNSGTTDIELFRGGTLIRKLGKKQSLDVGFGNEAITAKPSNRADFDAIYDRVDLMQATRSGRFAIEAPNGSTPAPNTLIIDLGKIKARTYRFFNSGTSKFKIVSTDLVVNDQTLAPEQSFDVMLSQDTTIHVEGIDNGKTINGIYEYVG